MKLRISPLAIAVGIMMATLSPAMALVHPSHLSGIALSSATHAPRPRPLATASAAIVSTPKTRPSHADATPPTRTHHHTRVTTRHHGNTTKHAHHSTPTVRARAGFDRQKASRRAESARGRSSKPSSVIDPSIVQHVMEDANWILQAQLPDGAIANWTDQQTVWPYLSNFAAMGLARAAQVTGNSAFSSASWRWLHWYASHEDGNGFVTDYKVQNGQPESTGDMDSTDAYAGTFLMAVRDTFAATGDLGQLRSLKEGVVGAVHAVEATQDADGLTWAKPAWHVKYAMDQGETYGGLRAAVAIAQALHDSKLASRAGDDATRMYAGFQKLWDPQTGAYDWAVHDDGFHQPTDWNNLYPDALQQAWAVAFGLADPSHVRTLVSHFTQAHPQWDQPNGSDTYDSGNQSVGYWAPAGWAIGVIGGDTASGAQSIRQAALAANRAWPFTPSDSGQLILLETWNGASSLGAATTSSGGSGSSRGHREHRATRRRVR